MDSPHAFPNDPRLAASSHPASAGDEGLLERAAQTAYRICAETSHVTLAEKAATAIRALSTPAMSDRQEYDGEALLRAVCDAQSVSPYRGWNLTALNKAVDKIREHLGLPSIRDLNPDIAAMQDAAEANKGAIRALTPTPDRIGKDAVREAAQALIAKLDECDPHIADAFLMREMKCGPYDGPNYSAELRDLRSTLSATPAQEGEDFITAPPPDIWKDLAAQPVDETERLREALEKIATCESYHPSDVVAIARAALRPQEGEVSRG